MVKGAIFNVFLSGWWLNVLLKDKRMSETSCVEQSSSLYEAHEFSLINSFVSGFSFEWVKFLFDAPFSMVVPSVFQ